MRLEPVGSTAAEVLPRLRAVLAGSGPALGLGMVDAAPGAVPEGTAAVITTSGSTGVPKSVVLSRGALLASTSATAARIGEGAWLLALPAGYVAGLQVMIRSLRAGYDPVVLEGRFSPQAFAAATLAIPTISRYTSLVPVQLARLLDAAETDGGVAAALRAYDAILVGGQALPATTFERARDAGARIVRTYGSTETCGGCVYDGVPLDDVVIDVVDGEVRLSGPTLADGYLGDAELTDRVFVRDATGVRWYRTGDAGLVDDGVLRIHGRIDNVIVSGGVNISLDRVERVVKDVPGLAAAVVVGVPDAQWGEASVIVVAQGDALRRSESVQLQEARAAVGAVLGAPARPARLVLVDELAMLPSGKPDREAIRRAVAALHRP
ncbi:acyl-CoA synthetase [Microbacterium protaetiae]|uniref:Acyl-CoA synthetase n=1 Tax=Microbacterium protaetiae TaxID=2509458 RepID=A0A4P6EGY5_9MICO|nr:AMP-binding protein [Microbacterium protaetiae]QAY60429.1 acyl-CoA synthetase [Microbacterium protaetiae]